MAETVVSAVAIPKFFNHYESDLLDRHEYHLCNTVARLDLVRFPGPVPARDEHLTLIVGIDQTGQVAEHQAVFVSESGTRKQNRRQVSVTDMNRETSGNQLGFSRANSQRLIYAGAHIEPGRPIGCIVRQGYGFPDSGIQNLQFNRSQ